MLTWTSAACLCTDACAGWIYKVYADATYQYVRKGQLLFTIYSPDLMTTEQEYLLAKRNSEQVRTSTVSGLSTGALTLPETGEWRGQLRAP